MTAVSVGVAVAVAVAVSVEMQAMKILTDEVYPQVEKILIVMDYLNTISPVSVYQTYKPDEALSLTNRLEFHYTVKHGNWLSMTKFE